MEREGPAMRRSGATSPIVRALRFVVPAAGMVAAAGLSACGSISHNIAATMSQMPAVGVSDSAPARPESPPPYPAVHDLPPPRERTVLTEIEQQKLEDDLVNARDRQLVAAGKPVPKRKKAEPPGAGPIPASNSRTIY